MEKSEFYLKGAYKILDVKRNTNGTAIVNIFENIKGTSKPIEKRYVSPNQLSSLLEGSTKMELK
ncbi:MAG: hypothetical protein ABH811_02375 [archaeon]